MIGFPALIQLGFEARAACEPSKILGSGTILGTGFCTKSDRDRQLPPTFPNPQRRWHEMCGYAFILFIVPTKVRASRCPVCLEQATFARLGYRTWTAVLDGS
jgi:hypothetical protein